MLIYYKVIFLFKILKLLLVLALTFRNLRSLALRNNIFDLVNIIKKNEEIYFKLYLEIEKERVTGIKNFNSYDYGQGYFYQSFQKVFISGFRNTEERVLQYDLNKITKNKEILDIGCNSAFLLLSLTGLKSAVGIDINPHLINIANITKRFLKLTNFSFFNEKIETFDSKKKFDIVFSLANHSTIDGNINLNKNQYFSKCASFLKKNGTLFFESHPEAIENKMLLEKTIISIKKYFNIISIKKNDLKGFLDQKRTIIICKRK